MKEIYRTCLYCGKTFLAKRNNQKYCDKFCVGKVSKKPSLPPKTCIICGAEFLPWSKVQVTCGKKECVAKNSNNKKKSYKYDKNEGLTVPKTKRKKKKPWSECTPAERWERMTWDEIAKETARCRLTYGQAQVMKMQGTLPSDFGEKRGGI